MALLAFSRWATRCGLHGSTIALACKTSAFLPRNGSYSAGRKNKLQSPWHWKTHTVATVHSFISEYVGRSNEQASLSLQIQSPLNVFKQCSGWRAVVDAWLTPPRRDHKKLIASLDVFSWTCNWSMSWQVREVNYVVVNPEFRSFGASALGIQWHSLHKRELFERKREFLGCCQASVVLSILSYFLQL